jgi:uracil-DNA glycosylase
LSTPKPSGFGISISDCPAGQCGPSQIQDGHLNLKQAPSPACSLRPSAAKAFVKLFLMSVPDLLRINQEIIACTRCPRLIAHCRKIGQEKRRAYLSWDYWAKPVPGFGDPRARLLILGLAPGAHGSNRTGRPFTGDGSGNFLYPVLHKAGFASQPNATHRDDGLRLIDAYITAAVRCAPPENKPAPEEIANCAPHLDREFAALSGVKVVVVLGKIAFDAYLNYLKRRGQLKSKSGFVFGHGETYPLPDGRTLLCSYHPSLQNTLTGKLTEKMFLDVFCRAARLIQR